MKMWIMWAALKRDGYGKNHLYGFMRCNNTGETEKNIDSGSDALIVDTYVFHCQCSSRLVHLRKWKSKYRKSLFSLREEKLAEGYKTITQTQIEYHWPEVLTEIEMLMVMRKLQHGN